MIYKWTSPIQLVQNLTYLALSYLLPPSFCLLPPSLLPQPSDSHLVVGMTTRLLSIKHRPQREAPTPPSLSAPTPRGGTYRYFVRGKTYKPASVSQSVFTFDIEL